MYVKSIFMIEPISKVVPIRTSCLSLKGSLREILDNVLLGVMEYSSYNVPIP